MVPQNTPKWSFLGGKPMVVGYHYFRKPPYVHTWFKSWEIYYCHWLLWGFYWAIQVHLNSHEQLWKHIDILNVSGGTFWGGTYCWWKKSCTSWEVVSAIIFREFYIPGGCLGFLPSTVFVSKVPSCLLVQQLPQKFSKLRIWPDLLLMEEILHHLECIYKTL